MSKYKAFNIIWLLNKVKKITAGVDKKANPELTLHEYTMDLFTMRQGHTDAYEECLNRFKSRLQNMEMAGGKNLLYSPQLTKQKLNDSSEDEVNAEKERFRSMCFLIRSGKTRYGELPEHVKKGA